MSSQQPPTGPSAPPGSGGAGEEPSPEEVRAYLEQLRGAPVDQVIAEVASALLNAAQVKLGRRDARLLLDVVGDLTDRVRGQLPDELTNQLSDVLAQLRLGQVEAEREVAQANAQGREESGDLPEGADDASDAPAGGDRGGSDPKSSSAASRLWTPGS